MTYVIEEVFHSGKTEILKKTNTMEDVHKTLFEITNNSYGMNEYKINSFANTLHYHTLDNSRNFNVHLIKDLNT